MPNKRETYHIYTHNNPLVITLGDFIVESESLGVGLNIVDLLNYQDENDNYNLDNLIDRYSLEEKEKYQSLIDKIINSRGKEIVVVDVTSINSQDNSNTNPSTVNVDNNKSTPKSFTKGSKLMPFIVNILYKGGVDYLKYPVSDENTPFINQLYDGITKDLFKKFIYEIETTTPYIVKINNAGRTLAQQKEYIKKGWSATDFSYHMIGMAVDMRLELSPAGLDIDVTGKPKELNKQSPNKDWIDQGIIKIADKLHLTWGGRFTNVDPDPVHFDTKLYYVVDKKGYMNSLGPQDPTAKEDDTSQNPNDPYLDLPLYIGTVLNLPLSNIDRQVLLTETNQAVNTVDFESFLAKELVRLLSEKGYKRVFEPNRVGEKFKGTVQEIYPHISVWVWSRALSIDNIKTSPAGRTSYNHQLINITPYITSLTTNVAENGGNFNINISPVVGELKVDRSITNWSLKGGSQKTSKEKKYSVNSGHIHYVENDELKRSNFFFDKSLQANDIVFIKFEQLEIEDKREDLNDLEFISTDKLPNQIFDMIALVDNINVSSSFENSDVNISVSGRDLVKLIIEDGVYFYPTVFTDSGIFANVGATNNRLERFGKNGEILNRFQGANKSVERSLKFIINNLGQIEICPSSLFDSYEKVQVNKDQNIYEDKRSKFWQLADVNSQEVDKQKQKINDKRDKILENISNVRKNNNFKNDPKINKEIYDNINKFISDLIQSKSITTKNQKIVSWDWSIGGKFYKNRIHDNIDNKLLSFDRFFVKDKNKVILKFKNTNDQYIYSSLQSLYDKSDKQAIIDNKLFLFNNFGRKAATRETQLGSISYISIDEVISELDSYANSKRNDLFDDAKNQSIFKAVDIQLLKDTNNIAHFEGHSLYLGVAYKLFTELNDNEKSIFSDIYNLIIEEKSIVKTVNTEELKPMLGIWQIIKLVIDDSIKSRRLSDPSIGNESGSLLNAFRKICQDPFCEFYTDTYGDQFYFIARKKPFDFNSINSMLEGRVVHEEPVIMNDSEEFKSESQDRAIANKITIQNLILDIEEKDVISDSLSYSTEAYSWYKLNLANLTSGSESTMAFAYLRAVYFEEFADIYGSKPLDLTTSYIPYSPVLDKNKKLPTAYFIKQGVYDLKYMIESHAYLPFTRMGTIVINGDRRIKRGTFIRYKGTNEIFYVDSVSHSYSIGGNIDRTTTLQVSRGMVERFIGGVPITLKGGSVPQFTGSGVSKSEREENNKRNQASNTINVSYFNICELPIDENIFKDENSTYTQFQEGSLSKWKVNKEVFNFFLKKLQFAKKTDQIS